MFGNALFLSYRHFNVEIAVFQIFCQN